jgi:hypothetical protein
VFSRINDASSLYQGNLASRDRSFQDFNKWIRGACPCHQCRPKKILTCRGKVRPLHAFHIVTSIVRKEQGLRFLARATAVVYHKKRPPPPRQLWWEPGPKSDRKAVEFGAYQEIRLVEPRSDTDRFKEKTSENMDQVGYCCRSGHTICGVF